MKCSYRLCQAFDLRSGRESLLRKWFKLHMREAKMVQRFVKFCYDEKWSTMLAENEEQEVIERCLQNVQKYEQSELHNISEDNKTPGVILRKKCQIIIMNTGYWLFRGWHSIWDLLLCAISGSVGRTGVLA